LSDDPWLEWTYRVYPDTIDLSEFMVITNVVSGRNDIIALFWQNKLGVDVDVCNNHFCVLILGVLLSFIIRTTIVSSTLSLIYYQVMHR
jgi:hypothetical protein